MYYEDTKRSESHVLSNSHTEESRGYVNAGTQQFHEVTPDLSA